MSTAGQPGSPSPRAQAKTLAGALRDRGFTVTVFTKGGHQAHPCVHAVHRTIWHLTENIDVEHGCGTYIYLAPEDGHWWFWWPSLEPIAPASQAGTAADTVARVLRTAHQAPPGNGSRAAETPGTATGAS